MEAPKQFDAKRCLEALDLLADGAGRDAEFVGGAFEAQMARGGLEGAQAVQRRKPITHRKALLFETDYLHGLEKLSQPLRRTGLIRSRFGHMKGQARSDQRGSHG